MKRFAYQSRLPALAAAGLLAGCAAYGPGSLPLGASLSQIVDVMGEPTARYDQPGGGERLEYRRGPSGLHTYMLEISSDQRMVSWTQVLDQRHFDTLAVGMTRDQVLNAIGHPGAVQALRYQHRELWSYRYVAPVCQLFQVSFGEANGRAVEVGYGRDSSCDPDRD